MRLRLMAALLAASASALCADTPRAAETQVADEEGPSRAESVRFLAQASFGPAEGDIARVRALGYAGWIEEQARLPARAWTPRLLALGEPTRNVVVDLFWENAIEGEDALRARVAYALANIVTVSLNGDLFYDHPEMFAQYHDILNEEALGNYGDLIRQVSLSPAMGVYLSHLGNEKADPERGIAPDENYAREVMQLFTIGLEELSLNGRPKGQETYDTEDVTGLAAVFTGLSYDGDRFRWPTDLDDAMRARPMTGFADYHEPGGKRVLGRTIPAGTDAEASVDAALDHLLAHRNLAPFVSKQMIQHLVTSNPAPPYVARVSHAFNRGTYTADGVTFGDGRRGDMTATVAAILLDREARDIRISMRPDYGRVRDPILRFAHLGRAFRDDAGASFSGAPVPTGAMHYANEAKVLGQKALSPPSVFGWYRPGYVSPGGWGAANGKVAPEMQLATASNMTGYISWMAAAIDNNVWGTDFFDMDYEVLHAVEADADALVAALDERLTGGTMSATTRERVAAAVELIEPGALNEWTGVRHRISLAVLMTVTAPDYAVQR